MRIRLLIFVVAVVVRGVVGWIFFGSVDVTNAMLYSPRLFDGAPPSSIPVPYLPGIYQFLVWLSGVLAVHTAMPLTFCYKLFPLLFDGALAVLVHDAVLPDRRRARNAGLLYALAPVSVIVTALHTQWDAIAFSFLLLSFLLAAKQSAKAHAFAGAAFVLSVLTKPIAIPLLPLLFPAPWRMFRKEHRRHTLAMAGGMAACAAAYLVILFAAGDPLRPETVQYVLKYAGGGAQLMGLPKLLQYNANRLLNLLPILLLVPLYWKRLIGRNEAVLLTFCAFFGTSGLSPQYLLWLVPLFLICGRERFAALYGLITGIFLVVYYENPGLTGFNMENLGAYAPLEPLAWLAPAATNLGLKTFLFGILGNFFLPLSLLIYFVRQTLKSASRTPVDEHEPPATERQLLAPVSVAIALTLVAAVVAWAMPEPTGADFAATMAAKTAQYEMHRYTGPGLVNPHEPTWVIPAHAGIDVQPSLIDAVMVGYLWVLAWVAAAWRAAPRTATEERAAAAPRNVPLAVALSIVAIGAVLVCFAVAVRAQQLRVPHVDEAEYLHAGYLIDAEQRIYRDFFEHHSPLLFQTLALLVPREIGFTVYDVGAYLTSARKLMGFFGAVTLLAVGWLAWRISRWPGAAVVVMAPLLLANTTWLRGLIDIRNDVPGLMLFWTGAALLLTQWSAPMRAAMCSGIGIGLAFAAALWNPKWPFVSLLLGGVYLFRVWQARKGGPRAVAAAVAWAALVAAIPLALIRSAATFTDYVNFTFRYSASLFAWFADKHQPFFDTPLKFCHPAFKGPWPILAGAIGIALLAWPRLRNRLDVAQRWQLAAVLAMMVLAVLEVRFLAPYPNLWAQVFMMWCFTMAVVYATVAGMLIGLVPPRAREAAGALAIAAAVAVCITALAPRMTPAGITAPTYYPTMKHMLEQLKPRHSVWLGAGNHPITVRDAHYYWFGFNEHVAHNVELQKRGALPPFLPPVREEDLPPCRVARGLDRRVLFLSTGHDLTHLPLAQRCTDFLLRSGRALQPGPPFGGFIKIER